MLLAIVALAILPKPLQGVHRIVMMGDSITQMGASPKGYVTLVRDTFAATYPESPIEVINVGIGGQKAPDMLARFQRDVIDKKPDLVTISVGVNDVWHDFRTPTWSGRVAEGNSGRGVPLPKYSVGVEAMIVAAKSAGIRVVLLSPSLIYEDLECAENRRLREYVAEEARLARQYRTGFINLHEVFRRVVRAYQREAGPRQLLLTTDGVHVNDAGNALIADSILRYLKVPVPNQVSP
jgi:lysophospholipase L1-like esterase